LLIVGMIPEIELNLIRESLFDFMPCKIGKCFNLQFANVLFSIKKWL